MRTKIVTYYLEMTDITAFRPSTLKHPEVELKQAKIPCPELNRFLYTAVGGDWYWIDRLNWTYEQWLAYLDRPELETWVAYLSGTPAGYFELEVQPESNVEIAYFGLLPQFTGRGLGGYLLTAAIERAWQIGASRVWVHTCSLDHPHALKNYQARGFQIYKEEISYKDLPEKMPGHPSFPPSTGG
jgi:GNAT superfamily N-acetyltransferase